ncbi:MAG TPA: sulfatase [Oceanipulchritudo sp.]|nr:sulfatase [Oceanipulchritudo sp.]
MKLPLTITLFLLIGLSSAHATDKGLRPNILFCIMDDASYPHMGAYGTDWVQTPAFDRIAAEGILFQNAYTPNAKCAPSRASVLTGRNSWQLDQIGNHLAVWPEQRYITAFEALGNNGYHAGWTGKGWAPGIIEKGAERLLTGKEYNAIRTNPPTAEISNKHYSANFQQFLDDNEQGKPWVFWFGPHEPHRFYTYGSGAEIGGKQLSDIDKVPAFWPDNTVVRNDMLDYAFEIEYADQQLGEILKILEERGQLDNTLIVVTADNGMPFPRCKGLEYEYSNHLPLAIMWKAGIRNPGRSESGFVSFVDFAPTFLKVAGVDWASSGMEPTSGKDLVEIFEDSYRKQDRSYILLGQERHDYGRPGNQGYPIRSIIRNGFLYMHNFKPDLWPAGNPETGYLNTDGSPTKTVILNMRREDADSHYWQLNFGKNPQEQLYHIAVDPECLVNLASREDYLPLKESLRAQLFADLARQGDPRVVGPDGDVFDRYPWSEGDTAKDFYERYMAGQIKEYQTGWVEPTDYE